MRIDREALIQHLEKVRCRRQIQEAVFGPGWACWALTVDKLLLIHAPPLKDTAPLPELLGVADLPLLIRTLKDLPGDGHERGDVFIRHDGDRLVIDKQHRGVIRLMTAPPHLIESHRDDDEVAAIESRLPDLREGSDVAVGLSRAVLDGVVTVARRFGAKEAQIVVQADGAVRIQVGNEHGHTATFPASGQPDSSAPEQFRVSLGAHFFDVLGTVNNYTDAALHLSGPEELVLVTDGPYAFMLSPRVVSAE